MSQVTKILLKARPTRAQLRDRLAEPRSEGLELYLDRRDLLDPDCVTRIGDTVAAAEPPRNFIWIVEAPTRTLGGAYFDLTADTADSRETLRRVIAVGQAIGAVAANVHVVAPTTDPADLTEPTRRSKLDLAEPLLREYVGRCEAAGLIPQVENIPPVGRMREAAYVFSSIGLAPSDLRVLSDRFPSLRFTVDVSHAALYQNWRAVDLGVVAPELRAVAELCRQGDESAMLSDYIGRLAPWTMTVHVSNSEGLLGEGLRYREGPEDLDRALRPLLGVVPYFVTETLEPDDEQARGMRDAQRNLLNLRDRAGLIAPIGGAS